MEQVDIHVALDLVVEQEPDLEELLDVEEAVKPGASQRARNSRTITNLTNEQQDQANASVHTCSTYFGVFCCIPKFYFSSFSTGG